MYDILDDTFSYRLLISIELIGLFVKPISFQYSYILNVNYSSLSVEYEQAWN